MLAFDMNQEVFVTFAADSGLAAGSVCKITANGTVGACKSGDSFCGVAKTVRSGNAGVALTGYVTLPYTGTAPALGFTALTANGTGGVTAGDGEKHLVVQVDTAAKTVGLFL